MSIEIHDNDIVNISKVLFILPVAVLVILAAMFVIVMFTNVEIFMVTWAVFTCGVLGGFVSIQQRLKNMDALEIRLLSNSIFRILLIPLYGGIFALVLYSLFYAEILSGHLFPTIYVPVAPEIPIFEYFKKVCIENYPQTGQDWAKLLFWSFVAGFCERLVPQLVNSLSRSVSETAVNE